MAQTQATDRDDTDDPSNALVTAATALTGAIRTTLGPNGMDKMLISQNGTVVVTNDGASILEKMDIDHPAGRMIERIAGAQSESVGDGTTTTVLLTGELLDTARSLREDGLHPTAIVDGYTEATDYASGQLSKYGTAINGPTDSRLTSIAETAVTGRWDDESAERFADLTLGALRSVDFDTSRLTLKSYAGGELRESEQIDGLVVDTASSSTSPESASTSDLQSFVDPTVAMVDTEVGIGDPDSVQSVQFTDPDQVSEFQTHERDVRTRTVERIVGSGADVLFCQQSIDEQIRNQLSRRGVLPVERTRQDEFDVIARATGSSAVHTVDQLGPADTGQADAIEQRLVGTTPTLTVSNCAEESRTSLLLRGGTPHVAEEVRRIVVDCIDVVRLAAKDGQVLPGGGAVPVALAADISAFAESVSSRKQLVVEAFAEALEGIPRVLATNAGQDPIETLTSLRHRHHEGESAIGIGPDGCLQDMAEAGVMEPKTVFDTALQRAVEAVSMLLRIDDVMATSGQGGHEADGHSHDGHNHAGMDTGGYPWAVGH